MWGVQFFQNGGFFAVLWSQKLGELYRVYQKKGNRTLTSYGTFNILSTEIIL